MSKPICFLIILLFAFNAYSQRERVHLDLDKYTCRAGDTVWFKASIFKGLHPTFLSTNMYVGLYTKNAVLLGRFVFPIFHGQGAGQVIMPDSIPTGNYFLVALTKEQLNYDSTRFFSLPIMVYNKDKPRLATHKRQVVNPNTLSVGSIKGITWMTSVYPGKATSFFFVDTPSGTRHFSEIKQFAEDSVLRVDFTLTDTASQKYTLFPLDTTKEDEVIFLYEDSVLIGRQFLHLKDRRRQVTLTTDTLDTSPLGYNSWKLQFPDSIVYYSSVSVVDADRSIPSPVTIDRLKDTRTENLTAAETLLDTAYITLFGKATRESGKKIKDPFSQEMVMAGVKDNNFVFTKIVELNQDGNFTVDSLFFFDSIALNFQIKRENDGNTAIQNR
jgi:hypothetical protein